MAIYKVLSNNCALGKQYDTVDSAKFAGINFEALVQSGHLEEVKAVKANQTFSKEFTKEKEEK